VEESLEVPVARAAKDEGARFVVNLVGKPARVTRARHREEQSRRCPLRTRSKASEGRNA